MSWRDRRVCPARPSRTSARTWLRSATTGGPRCWSGSNRVNADKLGRRLASVGDALDQATDEPWRKALGAQLLKRSRRLGLAIDEAGHIYAPERLHQVRIAAKKLRYGLELAADSGTTQAAPHVRTIKRAQELLGKLHDLQVLQTHIAAVQTAPHSGRTPSRAALDGLARSIEDQCRHLHGRYVASLPSLRETTLATRKTIVPLLARTPRRRALKMSLSTASPARAASASETSRAARGAGKLRSARAAGTPTAAGGR